MSTPISTPPESGLDSPLDESVLAVLATRLLHAVPGGAGPLLPALPPEPLPVAPDPLALPYPPAAPDLRPSPPSSPATLPSPRPPAPSFATVPPVAPAAPIDRRPDSGGFYFLEYARGARPADPEVPGWPATRAPTTPPAPAAPAGLGLGDVQRDFPILAQRVNGRPLVWLDNGATTQKPRAVIDRLVRFYETENSNIHRAAHELAARATDAYEGARATVARFLGAGSPDSVVFVRGATEGINLVANTWGRQHIGAGDEILVSYLEHHANIVPWQLLAARTGAKLTVIPVDDTGQLRLAELPSLLGPRTRLVALTAVSNALGTITPVAEVIAAAHAAGARVLVDGAQSVAHLRTDVTALDADFFVFSGHKVYGPTGIGALYGKPELLAHLPPWQGGGNMISDVTFEQTIYAEPPARFEAGTGTIADAVGLGAALDYLDGIGIERVALHEHDLLHYATPLLREIPGLRIIGTAAHKAGVLSLLLDGYTPAEVGAELNRAGVAVRAGHHCAQPILRRFGVEATVRATFALYNTRSDVDCLVGVLQRLARARRH